MENEIWKDVIGFEGMYRISNKGRVLSLSRTNIYGSKNHTRLRSERFLKISLDSDYLRVRLRKNNRYYTKTIHRLIAENFIPNPLNKKTVNHINGIKKDNRIENLEWNTYSENIQHAYNTGLNKGNKGRKASLKTRKKQSEAKLGSKHHNFGKKRDKSICDKISKSNKGKAKEGVLILNTENGVFYKNIRLASESININQKTLWSMLNGLCRNKTSLVKC